MEEADRQAVRHNPDSIVWGGDLAYADGREDRLDRWEEGFDAIGDGAWGVGARPVHDPADTWYLKRAESERHVIVVTLHGAHQHFRVISSSGEWLDEYPAVTGGTGSLAP